MKRVIFYKSEKSKVGWSMNVNSNFSFDCAKNRLSMFKSSNLLIKILPIVLILVFCFCNAAWAGDPEADLNLDHQVNFKDFSIFAAYWLDVNCADYNNCDGADFEPNDGVVDSCDLDRFCSQWLDWEEIEVEDTFTSIGGHDGWVMDTGKLLVANSGDSNDSAALRLGRYEEGATEAAYRSVVSFDTSTLPFDANVIVVTLQLTRGVQDGNENPFDWGGNCLIDINSPCIGSSTALAGHDYNAPTDAVAVASFSADPCQGMPMVSSDFDANGLDAINLNSYTQMRVYFDDIGPNEPNIGWLGFYAGDSNNANYRPKLTIRYIIQRKTLVEFTSIGSDDGRVWYDPNYIPPTGNTNTSDNDGDAIRLGDAAAGSYRYGYKSILSFDTSTLPDNVEITSARLKLIRGDSGNDFGTNPFDWGGNCLVDVNSGCIGTTDSTLEIYDWYADVNAVEVASFSADPGNGNAMTSTDFDPNSLSSINKTGKTQLRIYMEEYTNFNSSTDYIGFYSGDYTEPNKHPTLIVEYLKND